MNNKKLFDYLVIAFGILFFIFNLITYIQSYSFYADEYGTDISFDEDSLVGMFAGVAVIIFGLMTFVKDNEFGLKVKFGSLLTVSSLYTFYPLAAFIKPFSKALGKVWYEGKEFVFSFVEHQEYLYTGLLGLVCLIAVIVKIREVYKNSAESPLL